MFYLKYVDIVER